MNIVYTAITGNKDELREDWDPNANPAVAFVDYEPSRTIWQTRGASEQFLDPRRNARCHKILAHMWLPEASYSLWMDGPIAPRVSLNYLIDKYLKGADICLFKHSVRNNVYEEINTCREWGVDGAWLLDDQEARYKEEVSLKSVGLFESGVILRRHSPQIEALNNAWWAEVCRYSKRDQISLPYVLNKLGIKYNLFPGSIKAGIDDPPRPGNPYFDYGRHQHDR